MHLLRLLGLSINCLAHQGWMSLFYWLQGSSKNLKLIKLMLRKQSKRVENIPSLVLYIALVFSNLEFLVFVIEILILDYNDYYLSRDINLLKKKKKKLLSRDVVCFLFVCLHFLADKWDMGFSFCNCLILNVFGCWEYGGKRKTNHLHVSVGMHVRVEVPCGGKMKSYNVIEFNCLGLSI